MPLIFSFLWDKTPGWLRWTLGGAAILVLTPGYVVNRATSFVNSKVDTVMESHVKDQALIDQKQSDAITSMKEDLKFIKYYLVYKKAPPSTDKDE